MANLTVHAPLTSAEIAAQVAPIASPSFFWAGKAIFTVANPDGERYTFRANKVAPKQPGGAALTFLGLLVGPDNTANYAYLGILAPNGAVKLTKASRYTEASKPVRVAAWAVQHVLAGKPLPPGYAIHHEGRCCRCGRLLTTPESVARGMGAECYGKAGL